MKNKIKYLNFRVEHKHQDLLDDFKIVENPTKYNNLPDGEYLIRGNKKSYAKCYFVKDNVWYLTEEIKKDNGHYYCNAGKYQLFPNLPEKDWELLNKVLPKLSSYWKRATCGRNHFMEIRELKRNMTKDFMEHEK